MSKEIISDELLRKAVARAIEIESSMYERKFALEKEHSFSGKYAEQMKGLLAELDETKECSESKITDYSVKKISTRVKILLIAAIVMLMGSMTVLAVEPLREKVYELIEIIFADHTYVSFKEMSQEIQDQNGNASSQNEKANINNYPLKLDKVPEGYTLHSEDDLYEESGVYDYIQIFHNEDEKSILYEQIDINEIDLYSLVVSSDGTAAEEITICGEKAYVLTDEVQRNSVLYPKSDFIFLISGQEDVDSLVECLKSLFEEE